MSEASEARKWQTCEMSSGRRQKKKSAFKLKRHGSDQCGNWYAGSALANWFGDVIWIRLLKWRVMVIKTTTSNSRRDEILILTELKLIIFTHATIWLLTILPMHWIVRGTTSLLCQNTLFHWQQSLQPILFFLFLHFGAQATKRFCCVKQVERNRLRTCRH